jgi:hypothetical protein
MKKRSVPVLVVKTFFITLLIVAIALPAGWFTVAVGADQTATGGAGDSDNDVPYIEYPMNTGMLFVYTQDSSAYLAKVDDETLVLGTGINPYTPVPITDGDMVASSDVALDTPESGTGMTVTGAATSSDTGVIMDGTTSSDTGDVVSGIDFGCNNGDLVSIAHGQYALITLSPQAQSGGVVFVSDNNALINAAKGIDLVKSATSDDAAYGKFVKRMEQITVEESEAETEKNGGNRKPVEKRTEEGSGEATTEDPDGGASQDPPKAQ